MYGFLLPLVLASAPAPAAKKCPSQPVEVAWNPMAAAGESDLLPAPKGELKKRVAFWHRVWSDVPEDVWLIVDRYKPWIERARVDCRKLGDAKTTEEEAEQLCKDARRHAFLKAAKKHGRLALVEGHAGRLARARERGLPHRARARAIFAAEGVPADLADLAIVESLFRPTARSRAGAVGAYQFVRGSAKPWLRVDDKVDERLDVNRAASAAAQYLAQLHRRFDDWPLAVTAYNAGPTRIARIKKRARAKDLDGLLKSRAARRAPRFGFDAYNYWAQVSAVASLVRGDSLPEPQAITAARVEKTTRVRTLARCLKVDRRALVDANPALLDRRARARVPKGYVLTVPISSRSRPASGGG
jgi:membrane-bound lytic murein transglycosylase D